MKYRVMVSGVIYWSDEARRATSSPLPNAEALGFFTTRIVSALDRNKASAAAIESAREELRSSALIPQEANAPGQPTFMIEEISEIGDDEDHGPRRGFTFYPEKAS
jgi:hypothetical protein